MNAPDEPPQPRKSRVGERFRFYLPLIVLFLAFVVLAAVYLYTQTAPRSGLGFGLEVVPISFEADSVQGLGIGSELRCQGLVVGRVTEIRAIPSDGRLSFHLLARLDPKFKAWEFKRDATVQSGIGPAYLGFSSVELVYVRTVPGIAWQRLRLVREEESEMAQIQEHVAHLAALLDLPMSELAARAQSPRVTAAEQLALNMVRSSENLREASDVLAQSSDSRKSAVRQLVDTISNLQETSERGMELVAKLQVHVDTLSGSSERTLSAVDRRIGAMEKATYELIGQSPGERTALHHDLKRTVNGWAEAAENVNDLVPRVGDTFFGRMFIRKSKKRVSKPAPLAVRGAKGVVPMERGGQRTSGRSPQPRH